jgi:hypothetical protein
MTYEFRPEATGTARLHGTGSIPLSDNNEVVPLLSPSLLTSEKVAAYEMKFLLPFAQAEEVEKWARHHLSPDPHAENAQDGTYRVHSLYFDTDAFDVYHQADSYRKRKFRLRRYGDEPTTYLERKSKARGQVSKRRTAIHPEELDRLQKPTVDEAWDGSWFHERIVEQQLKPRCLHRYDRTAYMGTCDDGPIRLTLDRNIRCAPVEGYHFTADIPSIPLLPEEVILELKFPVAMPVLFKRLVQEQRLNPTGVSKYRRSVEACWLIQNGGESA